MCAFCTPFSYISPAVLNKTCGLVLLLKLLPLKKYYMNKKMFYMITKQAFIEDDLAEFEKILEEEWITEEDRFRRIFNGFDKATV